MKKRPRTPNPTELEIAAACAWKSAATGLKLSIVADPLRRHAATSLCVLSVARPPTINLMPDGSLVALECPQHRLRVETGNLPLAEIRDAGGGPRVELALEYRTELANVPERTGGDLFDNRCGVAPRYSRQAGGASLKRQR